MRLVCISQDDIEKCYNRSVLAVSVFDRSQRRGRNLSSFRRSSFISDFFFFFLFPFQFFLISYSSLCLYDRLVLVVFCTHYYPHTPKYKLYSNPLFYCYCYYYWYYYLKLNKNKLLLFLLLLWLLLLFFYIYTGVMYLPSFYSLCNEQSNWSCFLASTISQSNQPHQSNLAAYLSLHSHNTCKKKKKNLFSSF